MTKSVLIENKDVNRLDFEECRGRGRPKKTWEQCVKCDIRNYGTQRVEPCDKDKWKS